MKFINLIYDTCMSPWKIPAVCTFQIKIKFRQQRWTALFHPLLYGRLSEADVYAVCG